MKYPQKRPVAALVLLLALAALAGACAPQGDHDAHEKTTPPPIRGPLATAERLELATSVELPGSVVAERTSMVSVRVMATVTAVHVNAGDRVRRGDLLLEVDPQAAGGQVTQARGALAQARSALRLAERNAERFRALLADEAASQLELDAAEMQLEQAQGAVQQAEGALSAAESMASDTRVKAPAGGRVVRRMVDVGDLAAPGRPLVELESEESLRLAVSLPENLLMRSGLDVGDAVPVTLDARPGLGTLEAEVVEIEPTASASHAFRIEARLPELAAADRPAVGAAGRLTVETAARPAVAVPRRAIVRHGGLELVVLRTEDGKSETRAVTTGRALPSGDLVEVLSGLEGGEELVLDLGALPAAGSPVEVTP